MHPPAPHKIFWPVFLLVVKVIPVVVHLLLEEVEGLPAQGLAHQLQLHLVTSVEHHEESHRPQVIGLVVHLGLLPVESILDNIHEVIVGAVKKLNAELFEEESNGHCAPTHIVKVLWSQTVLCLFDTTLCLIKVYIIDISERFLNDQISFSDTFHVLDNISSTKS